MKIKSWINILHIFTLFKNNVNQFLCESQRLTTAIQLDGTTIGTNKRKVMKQRRHTDDDVGEDEAGESKSRES